MSQICSLLIFLTIVQKFWTINGQDPNFKALPRLKAQKESVKGAAEYQPDELEESEEDRGRKILNFVPREIRAERVLLDELTTKGPESSKSDPKDILSLPESKETKPMVNETKDTKSNSTWLSKIKDMFTFGKTTTTIATTIKAESTTPKLKIGGESKEKLGGDEGKDTDREKLIKQMREQMELESKGSSDGDASKKSIVAKKGVTDSKDILATKDSKAMATKSPGGTTASVSGPRLGKQGQIGSQIDGAGTQVSYRLKGIRDFMVPALLGALYDAGMGDKFVLASNNMPAARVAREGKIPLIRLPGYSTAVVLEEIMKLIRLDNKEDSLIALDYSTFSNLKSFPDGKEAEEKLKQIIDKGESKKMKWQKMDKDKFRAMALKASFIIQTGDPSPGSNLIITKGLMLPTDNAIGGKD